MGFQGKKSAIDYSVVRRINRLFKILEHRFGSDDQRIYLSHVAFLERMGWRADMGKVYRDMLRFHMLKVDAWIRAARFEWKDPEKEGLKKWENGRKLLLEGLRFNQGSEVILREVVQFMKCFLAILIVIEITYFSTSDLSSLIGNICRIKKRTMTRTRKANP